MRVVLQVLLGVIATLSLACSDHKEDVPISEIELRPNVSGVNIPTKLWDEIEGVYTNQGGQVQTAIRADKADSLAASNAKQVPLRYMKLNVGLRELHRGVLSQPGLLLRFGQGGGSVDFADYIKGKSGSFVITVKIPIEKEKMERFAVFFWSNGKPRKIGETIYGSSCDKVLNITNYFKSTMSDSGIQVSVDKQKYLTLLAGTYVFAMKMDSTLFVSQLTVKDSRYREWHCRVEN